jgi:hypothetical protein
MNIQSYSNVGNNLILTPNQVANLKPTGILSNKIVGLNTSYGLEPTYVLKKNDLIANNVIQGQGGIGSGDSLKERFPNASEADLEKRRNQQIKNAQRKYRESHRDEYNKYMQGLYFKMANQKKFIAGKPGDKFAVSNQGKELPYSTPDEWYEYRLKQAQIANAKYRAKKKQNNLLKDIDKLVVKDLKEQFKKDFPAKKGRPGKNVKKEIFSPDTDWYKENFEKRKIALQKEISEKGVVVPYSVRAKATKPDYPFEPDDTSPADRKLYDKNKDAYKEKIADKKKEEQKIKRQEKAKEKAEKKVEKQKEKAIEKENIKITIKENLPVEKTDAFKDWYAEKFGAKVFTGMKEGKQTYRKATFEEALKTQGDKINPGAIRLYEMTH